MLRMGEFSKQLDSLTWNLRQSGRKMFAQTSERVFTEFMTLFGRRLRRSSDIRFEFSILNCYFQFCLIASLYLLTTIIDFRENIFFFSYIFSHMFVPLSYRVIKYCERLLSINFNKIRNTLVNCSHITDAARPAHVIALETTGSIFPFSHTFASSRIAEIIRK